MSDDKYSIDDILNEVDNLRNSDREKSTFDGSVTDIIGGNEIDRALRAGSRKRSGKETLTAKQEKPDLSVTQLLNSIPSGKTDGRTARQLTEDEYGVRIARDVSDAADRQEKPSAREDVILPARQRTEEEVKDRIAREVGEAADIRLWEKLRAEPEESDSDDVKTYTPGAPIAHAAAEHITEEEEPNDEFEFHESLVTTDTMQLRKQKKIEDIKQALLKVDSEADSPDDMLDSLNPMESRAKAEEQLKNETADSTDTLAVAGNDLKRIAGGEERIKEYRPSASRKREPEKTSAEKDVRLDAAGIQQAFPGGLHVGETIIEALNKKIREDKKNETDTETESPAPAKPEPAQNEAVEEIKQANELAKKKKRRIASFILDDMSNDTEEIERAAAYGRDDDDEEEDEEDIEEPVDLDDENVIRDRLGRASKGLLSRLIILVILFGVTLFVAIVNTFKIEMGGLNNIINYIISPENYLYTHLTIGILSFAACSSVISNGFSRLLKLRPDNDTLCAFSHCAAIIALVPYLAAGEFIQRGRSQVYLMVSLAALIFNTLSKLCTVRTAQKNFAFTSSDKAKYFIERCDGDGAEQLAKGAVMGIPVISSMRKTEILCDFIISTYCEDVSDRVARRITPVTIAAAIIGGVVAFFTGKNDIVMNNVTWAVTVCSAIFALGATFSSSMTVTLPLLLTSRKNAARGSAILGYNAVEEFSETNAVLVEAKTLFPANSVKINNICGYDKPKNRCEGKINIDEAIIYAASLAVASDSVLADAFFNMLNYKQELLKPVSGCVYENNLGVMGWIDRRRVLLGNRQHMKSHEITVPNNKKEAAANVNNDEVIYLAVGGEVCLLFFVQLGADPYIKHCVQSLAYRDISLVIKTVDGMMTSSAVTELFDIDAENVRILPFEAHESFNEHTKFVPRGSAAMSCDGSFTAFAGALVSARIIREKALLGSIMQASGVALGTMLAIIFMLFTNHGMFNAFFILFYNLAWTALSLGVQFFKRS